MRPSRPQAPAGDDEQVRAQMMRNLVAAPSRIMKSGLQRLEARLKQRSWFRPLHIAYIGWRARHGGLPDWPRLLQTSPATALAPKPRSGSGKRILIATGTAGHLPSITVESLLGVALRQRGAAIDFLLCDRTLPACMMCEISWYSDVAAFGANGPKDRCDVCYRPSADMLDDASLNHIGISTQLTADDRQRARDLAAQVPTGEISGHTIDGVHVGEHAAAGALRFFARGDTTGEPHAEIVQRRYFEAALLTYYACCRLFEKGEYDAIVLNHGIYVPQGVIAETARRFGVRVVTWHPAYRRGCFIFNHNETYHQGLLNEPVDQWLAMTWSDRHRDQIERYLHSRWIGKQDWVSFHRDPEFDTDAIAREIGIDFSRPTIGLLTNVVWDAQLHYKANAFPGMLHWLIKTIGYFEGRPDLQLLIRIHPAETTGAILSRQPAVDEIRRHFQHLPENVYIIPADSRVSTYVAMSKCDAVLIYGTKTGVELTSTGIPVVVAGEAWIRGKGVTLDASSEADYLELLKKLPFTRKLDDATRDRALKYAYHFFFRRMIPLDCIRQAKGWPPFAISIRDYRDLYPGVSAGLDVICDGILNGSPFIYPAEERVAADPASVEHAN
jgi:Capsule polysaccharide biosynthesis protein